MRADKYDDVHCLIKYFNKMIPSKSVRNEMYFSPSPNPILFPISTTSQICGCSACGRCKHNTQQHISLPVKTRPFEFKRYRAESSPQSIRAAQIELYGPVRDRVGSLLVQYLIYTHRSSSGNRKKDSQNISVQQPLVLRDLMETQYHRTSE